MNTIKRDVYVLRDTIKIPIEVTKGTDMVGFEFAVRDYSIPGTAAAVAYVYHKSMEKPKGILCDINDSTISFTPDNNFFAVGMNELQIRVINNGKSLISFKEKIKCSDAMGFPDDEEESQQTLVEQLLTKVGKEEGNRKTADETEREERIAADAEEKKARAEADETIRANRIVALDEIDLVTEEGFFVDALAVKELNSKTEKTELTNERIVGKINGKSLYEKIVLADNITLSKSEKFAKVYIPHDIPVIHQIISCEVLCGRYKLPYIDEVGTAHTFLHMVDEKNFILMNNVEWKNYLLKFILRYTKYD